MLPLYGKLGLKYAKRRKLLKQGQDPMVQLGRKWKKSSKMQKAGIVATVAAPKAIFLGAGYLAGKDKDKDKIWNTVK